jgi:hypothetical protein
MKMLLGILAILCLIVFASGCVNQGSGNVTNETRNVSDFNQINTNGDMEIIVSPGNNNSVVVQGDSNVIPNIQTSVNNNILTVSNSNVIGGSKPAKIYITVVDLNAVQVGGSGNFTGTDLKLKSLNLFLSGSGSINLVNLVADSIKLVNSGSGLTSLSGNVKSQEIIISGTGEYKAKDLQSNTATVEIDGSGQTTLNVINQLNIIINGSGQVFYLGNPNIQQQITGSGTVKKVG